MIIALTGASGFVGRHVVRAALRRGFEVVAFSRDASRKVRDCVETRPFSLEEKPDFSGCGAVIHLAGESIVGVWTAAKRRRIEQSRVLGTRRVVEALRGMPSPPEVLVCASATGIYAQGGDAELAEGAAQEPGFLGEVCRAWEREAAAAPVRVVSARIGIVLGRGGGALVPLARATRLGLGATLGSGRQWMPWIHVEDLAELLLFAVGNLDLRGPVNAVAPWPVQNGEFTRTLAAVLHRPAFLRVPAFALRMAGDFPATMLSSQRAVPAAATAAGFGFRFPELRAALADACA